MIQTYSRLDDSCRVLSVVLVLVLIGGGCSTDESSESADSGRPPDSGEPPGSSTPPLAAPPDQLVVDLALDTEFYTQHLDAGGIPVVASAAVSPFAMREAKWIVASMLANREDLVSTVASSPVRLSIMAVDEFTTDIPEHSDLEPADYWDRRSRGLGATDERPAVSAGEENLLTLEGDPYSTESILVHEFAHVIHEQALSRQDPDFDARLATVFAQARAEGLWRNTYAATNRAEYFAEGVQSWFDSNREDDTEHNDVDTREELVAYDPRLAALLAELFGDNPWRYESPDTRVEGTEHLVGFDRSAAPAFIWPLELADVDSSSGPDLVGIKLENRVTEDWTNIVSPDSDRSATIGFDNLTAGEVGLFWVDRAGERVAYEPVAMGEQRLLASFEGHRWEVVDATGVVIGRFEVADVSGVAVLCCNDGS